MKFQKISTIIIITFVTVLLFCLCTAADGPLPITTEAEFLGMEPNGNYYLADDITITQTYKPIFYGQLDGNGHTVTVVATPFYKISGTVKNLTLEGKFDITTSEITKVSGLSTYVVGNSTIENIVSNVNISIVNESEVLNAGGLFLLIEGDNNRIISCVNNGDIYLKGKMGATERIGGISAIMESGYLYDCTNNGDMTATDTSALVGGLVGRGALEDQISSNDIDIFQCHNTGTLISGYVAGGMVAYAGEANIQHSIYRVYGCVNTGDIHSVTQSGGMIGYFYAKGEFKRADLRYCINLGDIYFGKSGKAPNCYGSDFIAYTNSSHTIIAYCIGAGKVHITDGMASAAMPFIGCSSANVDLYHLYNNYIFSDHNYDNYSWASASYPEHRQAFSYGINRGFFTVVNEDEYLSGRLLKRINEESKGIDGYLYSEEKFEVYPEILVTEPGDTDLDGKVDNTDALNMLNYIYDNSVYTLKYDHMADINKDGTIDNSDLLAVFKNIFNSEAYPLRQVYTLKLEGGTFGNGSNEITLNDGDYAVLTFSDKENSTFLYWMDENGNRISRNNVFVLNAHGNHTYTAVCEEKGLNELVYKNRFDYTVSVSGNGSTFPIIASRYGGLPVIEIEAEAFIDHTDMTAAVIPGSIEYIGSSAFAGCTGLERIYYCGTEEEWNKINKAQDWDNGSDSYTLIFASEGLEFATYDEGETYLVKDIGECHDILVIIPAYHNGKPVKGLDNAAFFGNKDVIGIILSADIEVIGDRSLYECTELQEIIFAGTAAVWERVEKGNMWNAESGYYQIYCTEKTSAKMTEECEAHVVVEVAEVPSDCCEEGHYLYYRCSECGKKFRDSEATDEIMSESEVAMPLTSHSFTKISSVVENNIEYIYSICENCGEASGEKEIGYYDTENNKVILIGRDIDYSFDVISDKDADYIKENISVSYTAYDTIDKSEHPELLIGIDVTSKGNGVYTVTAENGYKENGKFYAECGEGIGFAQFPVDRIEFSVAGEAETIIEYNENMIFLKALEAQTPGYYPYSLVYDEENDIYTLTISQKGIFNDNYIDRILCIGECTSAEDLMTLDGDKYIFGKIIEIGEENGSTVIKMSTPDVTEVFNKLSISSGNSATAVSDALNNEAVTITDMSAEWGDHYKEKIVMSDDFISALASAECGIEEYAAENGLLASKHVFSMDKLNVTITNECIADMSTGQATAKINVKAIYSDKVILTYGGQEIGTIPFSIEFNLNETLINSLDTNIIDLYSQLMNGMYFNYKLDVITEVDFKIDVSLDLKYTVTETQYLYYIRNPKSGVIHCSDCRMAQNYLNNESTHTYSLDELKEKYPDYLKHECKVCKPFTANDKVFVANTVTNVLHRGDCSAINLIKDKNMCIYHGYPMVNTYKDCKLCSPSLHIDSLKEHIENSINTSGWKDVFDSIKKSVDKNLNGNGGSKITENANPVLRIPLCYVFEMPIYVEPQFDFKLNANFKFHYNMKHYDTFTLELKQNWFGFFYVETNHYSPHKVNDDDPSMKYELYMQGEIEVKFGILLEGRLGFKGNISKHLYVGINSEFGMYGRLSGVLDAGTGKQTSYGAHTEVGIYVTAAFDWKFFSLTENGVTLLEEQRFPFLESGDRYIYQTFNNEAQEIDINGKSSVKLDDGMLEATYFDLDSMKNGSASLRWKGESGEYRITCRFVDSKGKEVNYCYLKNNVLYVNDWVPDEFEITMIINVVDLDVPDGLVDYLFTKRNEGITFFLDDLEIKIKYNKIKQNKAGFYDKDGNMVHDWTGVDAERNYTSSNYYTEKSSPAYIIAQNPEIVSVVLPDGVTSIGDYAFYYCSRLTSITFPDGVTSIGDHAFQGCSSLTSITLPDGLTSIGDHAFRSCSSLTSITLPDGLTSIGDYAFSFCSSLTSITLTDGLTSIGDHAFYYCNSLTSITFPDGLTSIGDDAFYNCINLTSITLPDTVKSIGDYAFYNCSSLTSITLPDGVTSIGDDAFYNCSSLTSITLPDGVTSIGDGAFYYCRSLTSIMLPDGLTSIGNYAFYNCSTLTSITLPDGLQSIGNSAFHGCSSLTSITLPDGLQSIGERAFSGCSSLTSITLPDGVTSIGYSAFSYCSSLTSITLPDGVTSIGYTAFSYCSSLTSITLPDGVTSIGGSAFEYCSSLTSITLPDGVTSIGNYAFFYCSLTSIVYNGTISQWNKISKGSYWNWHNCKYTIYCTDGTISE